jgi:hypothetical protein
VIFSTAISGLNQFLAKLDRAQKKAARLPAEQTEEGARFLLTRIRTNLSGRPGMPQPHTRNYWRSWHVFRKTSSEGFSIHVVETNAEQAKRLEHGFNGVDSLGRSIRQAPRPHIAPAVRATRDHYNKSFAKSVSKLWRTS